MLSKYLEMYEEKFGVEYHFYVGYIKTNEEIIEEIKECIRTNTKQKEPEYEDGLIY